MAVSINRRKSKPSKKAETNEHCSCGTFLFKILSRIPLGILLLILVYLWSSSTTIISGKIVHICVSSRKLNNLYCLSAGTQPNFEIPVPLTNNSFTSNIKDIDASPSTNSSVAVYVKAASTHERITDSKEIANALSSSTIGNIKEVANVLRKDSIPAVIDGTDKNRNEEIANAKKAVKEHLQLHRSWMPNTNHASCDGRGVYVYDLPSKFNKDLIGQCGDMMPWTDFCKYFNNEALGEPIANLGKGWYHTHQYSLEPIFHSRILSHPCRVYNESEAKLFYVPYYGGLDILRWHFKNVSDDVKDALAMDLMKWLEHRRPWVQNSGSDHVFVLGKISWDFRRRNYTSWGTRFLELEQMKNPIKLLIERQPWEVNDIAIPHPTFFHPHSDDDIVAWQQKIIGTTRKNLVSFAGAARPDQPESIRSTLINQCTSTSSDKCQFLDCKSGGCNQPESVTKLFLESEFCLQPPGDSPTRKSVFDSLVSGCIPVLFDPFTAYYQYPWHLPEDHSKYSVFIDQEEVRQMKVNVVGRLSSISARERDDMRRYIVYELLPGLVYGDSSCRFQKFQDAFSITVNTLLERVSRMQ
ncbi:PREDICTED: xyloglucan galactosyltransferase KATAMARI1 homolog isoform X2 [Populus euphratica]|uniref:Xyloglucan galactosyltransferase KATAMARI1 homolog isoform X1 n=1 Tax=Populus euphratica TaxID=75702 RepID=A0AAJ6UG37_POPEU|nr:PREDICTED: xyloglucan galactosyltransferase KATAMARI1 homolog isoform X1 [Populus euphratica]XP_011029254.1 PREDICTED: xyloglucan galactosyltransferase KATAMARI1 homolog isoform X2 [Populus euphratica]